MHTLITLAIVVALYTMMRAIQVLGADSTARAYLVATRVLAVLIVLAALAVFWAIIRDAQTLYPALRAAREVLAPIMEPGPAPPEGL